ncbi:phosphoglycerate mutase [Hysterangium stoloniferum]|nr:phosphoglycerate mutase [Hysterangium stoloniferum]
MITVTFVRHGESTDNLAAVWAGWKDAPLSNHGMNQAKACGEYFSNIPITAMYVSDLKRAHTTAKAIFDAQDEPKPSFTVSPDLREQHFGIAEGEPWVIEREVNTNSAEKVFPTLQGRDAKYPEGESLNDLSKRTNRAAMKFILPWIWDTEKTYGKKEGEVHLVVVSHGLCISELVATLVRMDADGFGQGRHYGGLANTAWTRATIAIKANFFLLSPPPSPAEPDMPLVVRVTHLNQHGHLDGVTRQKGGIGSSAYDPSQKDIRDFFGGGSQDA